MFYQKSTKALPKFKTKILKLDCSGKYNVNFDENEDNLDDSMPSHVCNFVAKNGTLTEARGEKQLVLPTSQSTSDTSTRSLNYQALSNSTFVKVYRYKYFSTANSSYMYMLIAYMSNKKLYYCNIFGNDTAFHPIGNYTFDTAPTAIMFRVNGEDVIAFCAPGSNMLVWYCDASPYEVSTAPTFVSICLCNNRLFAIDASKNNLVRFSSNTNPLDWTADDSSVDGAGEIDLGLTKGENRALISLLDNVYVINDYGISKISTYSNSSKFVVSKVYSTTARIYTDTAVVAGEDIYFVSTDGFYKFDGYKVEKIDLLLSKYLFSKTQKYINTCAFENKIYIACYLKFDDGYDGYQTNHNNALIEYDIASKKVNLIRQDDIAFMYPLQDLLLSKLIVLLYDYSGYYNKFLYEMCDAIGSDFSHKKIWRSGVIDFGNKLKRKILKKLKLSVYSDSIIVKVSNGEVEKSFSVSGYNATKTIDVDMPGYEFKVSFESDQNVARITLPQLVFSIEE